MNEPELEYVGFWLRVGAAIIDSILVLIIVAPLLTWYFGASYWLSEKYFHGPMDLLLNYILPGIAIVLFWIYRQATPGKMAIGARIVDARTGSKPSTGQLIGRYFAYYVSTIPLGLGLLWVGWDARKQGWHDMLAGTVVVRSSTHGREPVRFS